MAKKKAAVAANETPNDTEVVKTVQTVQNDEGDPINRQPYYEVAQDENEKWHWVLWASNGRALATNAVAYNRRNDLTEALNAVRANATEAKKVVTVHGGAGDGPTDRKEATKFS